MKNFKELVRKDTSDIFSYREEVYNKRREMEREFKEKFKNVVFKIGYNYYTDLKVSIKQSGDYELYALPVLDAMGTTGRIVEIGYFDFEKAEIASLDELEDTSFKVEGKTLRDFKEYLEHVGYDIKIVHGLKGYMQHQYFDMEIVNKSIEIHITKVRNKGDANKFSTIYNLMKRLGGEDYPISKVVYDDNFKFKCEEVKKIVFDKCYDMLTFAK